MAEGEEEEKKKNGEEDGERRIVYPPGFRFAPTDEELVAYYLLPRLQGRQHVPNDAVIEDSVYQCHPEALVIGKYKDKGQDGNWFFLTSRIRKYTNGKRPDRATEDRRGRWKASTGKEDKEVVVGGMFTYMASVLAYHIGPVKTEKKTKWLMRELTVPKYENEQSETLDEYVVCRIYLTPRKEKEKKKKKNDDEAGPSGTCEESTSQSASQLALMAPAGPKLSERQAGKRPVEEPPRPRQQPPPPQPDRYFGQEQGPNPGQFYAGGMQMRPVAGAKRPMVYHPHASMPRPPVPFTGQNQMPAYPAAVGPGFVGPATMMMRPVGAQQPGQAFGPRLPVTLPRRPQMVQRLPETEEMRMERVYQQHIAEMMRYGMMPQPGNAAYPPAQQPQPMAVMQQQLQQPYFGAGVNYNHQQVRHMVRRFRPCNDRAVDVGQCSSSAVPDPSGAATTTAKAAAAAAWEGVESPETGATNEGNDVKGDWNGYGEKSSVEVETDVKKVLPDGGTATADGDDDYLRDSPLR